MQTINDWLTRWQLPLQAVNELYAALGVGLPDTLPATAQQTGGEATVQSAVRIAAAHRGITLFRNNCGVATAENGAPIRYGLCNDSKQLNSVCKSSDLIGIGPGGRMYAYECKSPDWKFYQSDKRAVAQLAFIKLVLSKGGVAKFITGVDQI
jgi:hypothetical protein